MSEQNSGIKNLIEAHSWLGVIISVALFIIFWAGSIILFIPELQSWAETPAHPVQRSAPDMPLESVVEDVVAQYPLNREEHLTILLANEQRPYHQFYIDLQAEEGRQGPEQVAEVKVDPKTGEVVGSLEQFHLMDFLYQLHFDLRLPGGTWLVGLVTLIFLVLLFTGIYIHARKLFRNFFLYRRYSRRNKLLDIHNVMGVMSLPFTLMYALTGLIFNLVIIFQIAFAVFLYQGDQEALLADAGYTSVRQELSGRTLDMSIAYELLARLENDYGYPVEMLRFYNYGDDNAVIQVSGRRPGHFSQGFERYIRLRDAALLDSSLPGENNALRKGVDVLAALHFGDFAGLDLRMLYFLLGLGVCGMIVAGNLLWIDKRALQQNVTPRAISLVGNMTLGGCAATLVATAAAFLAERTLPLGLDAARGDWVGRLFGFAWLLSALPALVIGDKRRYLRISLYMSAVLMGLTIAADWLLYGDAMGHLWHLGYYSIVGVEIGLLLIIALCLWIAWRLSPGQRRARPSLAVAEVQHD